jgi:16S rRNA (guanine527-N7)-methyltransferase
VRSVPPEKLIARQNWNSLIPILEGIGVDARPAIERLRTFSMMLLEWSRGHSNLISRRDEPRLLERHIRESIVPVRTLVESGSRRWLDFGSGGGFPAIPLAIAGVPGRWTLVESRRNKTLFLRKAIEQLGLEDFEVVNDRLENLAQDEARMGSFDGLTSRATLKLGSTLELAAPLIAQGGGAFLWKGSGLQQELIERGKWDVSWRHEGVQTIADGPVVVARFTRL